jgi:ring-1,2-phenylacetyl-CoA epoxidase subunit PaaD
VVTATATAVERAREVAATVLDPEVPVLTIDDLGILRDVRVADDGAVEVDLTPTYSGCPAVEAIERDVETALVAAGFGDVRVRRVLAPAWTTDWISDEGRRRLSAYGIAPPTGTRAVGPVGPVAVQLGVRCPQCGSPRTSELSRFGSTACKALWRCEDCREPFDHFKVLR